MANTATLAIQIISDATRAAKGFQQASAQTSKFESRLKTANKVALATSGALLYVGVASVKQASQLQQSTGAIEATFGRQAGAVAKLAKGAADAVGLSRASYQQLAATFGAQLRNMGVAANQLVPKTDQLITLGADLAATYGGTTSQAVEALGSLLRGERDPIEKYGISIKQADIDAQLAAQGQDKLTGAAKKNAETQATLALLTQQSSSAQGQFARESGSAEGATQRMQAQLDNTAASLGTILLPAVTAAATGLASLAGFVESHSTAAQVAIGVIGALAAVVITTSAAMRLYAAAQAIAKLGTVATTAAVIAQRVAANILGTVWLATRIATLGMAAAMRILNAAMKANPIGLVITAVTLLIAGLILAYKKSETFRTIVNAVGKAGAAAIGWIIDKVSDLVRWVGSKLTPLWNSTKSAAVNAWNDITGPIQDVIDWVGRLISKIRGIDWPSPPGWVTKVLNGGLGSLTGSYHDYGAGAGYALAPSVFAAPGELKAGTPDWSVGRMGARGGPAFVQINVTGAIDPDSVARQIAGLLEGRNRRFGWSA